MSSNDIILIDRGKLIAYHCDFDNLRYNENEPEDKDIMAKADNLNKLIDNVREWQDKQEYDVEYGISFIN